MKTEERRCMNCMEPLFEDHTCLKCGHLVDEPQLPLALPYETLLQGRYLVGRAKKHGSQDRKSTRLNSSHPSSSRMPSSA